MDAEEIFSFPLRACANHVQDERHSSALLRQFTGPCAILKCFNEHFEVYVCGEPSSAPQNSAAKTLYYLIQPTATADAHASASTLPSVSNAFHEQNNAAIVLHKLAFFDVAQSGCLTMISSSIIFFFFLQLGKMFDGKDEMRTISSPGRCRGNDSIMGFPVLHYACIWSTYAEGTLCFHAV